MTVRVALAQFSGHIDKDVNIEKAENLARKWGMNVRTVERNRARLRELQDAA